MPESARFLSCWDDAAQYDAWYDTPAGRLIFESEAACIRTMLGTPPRKALEVGVGTGRFAATLGVSDGIDSSAFMLKMSVQRGLRGILGTADRLPYRWGSFDAVLMIMTLCFLSNPAMALTECGRVLCAGGVLVLGFVPAESAWGEACTKNGLRGHPIYSHARLLTVGEVRQMAQECGFCATGGMSTLFCPPGVPSTSALCPIPGIIDGAGFVAMSFERGGFA